MDSKRQLQIGELIKRNFSLVLQQDGRYIYGSSVLVSVTNAIVSPDLSQAKIYISVYGTDDKDDIIIKLEENIHILKQHLVARIKKQLRRMPEIFIFLDDTLDEMYKIDDLMNKI